MDHAEERTTSTAFLYSEQGLCPLFLEYSVDLMYVQGSWEISQLQGTASESWASRTKQQRLANPNTLLWISAPPVNLAKG